MRLLAVAIVFACTTARADEPDVQPMRVIADDAVYCEGLRKAWGNDAASCARQSSRVVRGIGTAEAWQASTNAEVHWTLMIRTAHGLRMSPEILLPGEQCGAGHCLEITTSPVLHVIHPHGRAAMALELRTVESWYVNERGAHPYRSGTGSTFIVCGDVAGGELRCELLGGHNDSKACTARIGDDGKIARTCLSTEQVELSP